MPRYELLKKSRYVNRILVQTSRGCHQDCTFCAEPLMNRLKLRFRPVDEVFVRSRIPVHRYKALAVAWLHGAGPEQVSARFAVQTRR